MAKKSSTKQPDFLFLQHRHCCVKPKAKTFYDVISIDALYVNFPFIYEAKIIRGKELVIKVKDERTTIYKEIEALSKLTEPKEDQLCAN